MWQLDLLCASAFITYGCFVGTRFLLYRNVEADKRSCKHYSVSKTDRLIDTGADYAISGGSPCTTYFQLTGTTSTVQTSFLARNSSKKLLLALLALLHRKHI